MMLKFVILLFSTAILIACNGEQQHSQSASEPAPPSTDKPQVVYPPVSVDMKLEKVSEHAYYVQGAAGIATDNAGFISNAGVVITDSGIVVFDALGSPSLAQLLLDKIRMVSDKPIVKVVASHYHADHIYGLQVFEDLGAEIIAPSGAQRYLASDVAQNRLEERRFSLEPWVNESTRLVLPDQTIKGETRFEVGGVKFVVSYLGSAHSDGDLTLYVENDRVLFSGDIIFEGRIPYVGDADTRNWLEILRQMETDSLAALIPGHGPAATQPNEAIKLTRRYLEKLRLTMGNAARDLEPFADAYAAADWGEFENLPAFDAANRRNAYQVFLAMEVEMADTQ